MGVIDSMERQNDRTRGKRTDHRGPLLIAASKRPQDEFPDDEIAAIEKEVGHTLEFGKVVCLADLYDCRPLKLADLKDARMEGFADSEYDLVDMWAWCLRDIRPVEPFPVRGYPGLYDVECELKFI